MSSARSGLAIAVLAAVCVVAGCTSSAQEAAKQPPTQQSHAAHTPATADLDRPLDLSDADLPPLPVTPYRPARPPDVVRSVFFFAAKHPEVLTHIPCFCGCQERGHKNNDDCFVAARDGRGRPTAWEPHGLG